jgi:predicted nucleic acid-binding protein
MSVETKVEFGYIDTSVLVAAALDEKASKKIIPFLKTLSGLYSSNLLEAEFLSVIKREGLSSRALSVLDPIQWILPDRPLSREYDRVLEHGYVKRADLWHLATALLIAPSPAEFYFLTLDKQQAKVAKSLGFMVFP